MSDAAVAQALADAGLAIQPAFLALEEVRGLRIECKALRDAGAFRPARVGTGAAAALHPNVRGDVIAWLPAAGASDTQRRFLDRMESLRVEINRRTYLGLFDFECHFALYPPLASYARHLDRFRDGGRRLVSCVVYLNEDWQEHDGGALRLYRRVGGATGSTDDEGYSDVLPRAGTLVAFASADVEHEVLPARRERASISGWFRTRA